MCERQQTFSFLSLNVRGLRDKLKRSKIFSWINHQKSDVILLQETFLTSEIETVIKQELNYHCFFNHGTNHARGVATLIKMNQSIEYLEHNLFCNGRVLAVRVKYGTYVYLILNVYAPTKRHEKERFFQDLFKWLKKLNIKMTHWCSVVTGTVYKMHSLTLMECRIPTNELNGLKSYKNIFL